MIVLLFAEWLHSGRVESLSLESISLQVLELDVAGQGIENSFSCCWYIYIYIYIYIYNFFYVFVYIDLQVLDCVPYAYMII